MWNKSGMKITKNELVELSDSGSFKRGKSYAEEGLVDTIFKV